MHCHDGDEKGREDDEPHEQEFHMILWYERNMSRTSEMSKNQIRGVGKSEKVAGKGIGCIIQPYGTACLFYPHFSSGNYFYKAN